MGLKEIGVSKKFKHKGKGCRATNPLKMGRE